MKKSFMTRVLAVSLSAAMAFSLPSANLMTASAAATVTIAKTASVKVGNTKTLKLKKNNSDWKITKVATNKSKVCTAKKKSNKAFTITGVKKGTATISVTIKSPKRKAAGKAQSKWKKVLKCKVTVKPKTTTPTTPTTTPTDPSSATDPTDASTPTSATDPTGATTPTGATDPSAPTGELGLTTVRSVARTTVEVVFNQPVDAVSKDNFKITEKAGTETVGVEDAILSENKLTATLTLASNAKLGTDYVIEISGLTCGGTAQGTLQGEYTSLTTQDQFVAVMESDATYLKADNTSNTQVRFKIYDGTGKLRTDVNNVEVRFTTTRGSVGGQSVVVRNGVADVQFTSQNVTSDVTAVITGEVIKADGYGDLLGLKSTTSILLTLNPGDIDASQGVLLTSINAITADRIIAYFNKEVKPEDFLQANGKVNTNRAEITVTDRVGLGDNTVNVTTILPLEEGTNKEKALQILVDRPLTDNSEISLRFVDKRYSVSTANTAYDRLVDATPPAVYNVNPKNLREIEVIFSEAVLTDDLVKNESDAIKDLSAQNKENYRINGQKLSDISTNASVAVSTDADKRHIVTITLGTEDGTKNGRPVYLKPNTLYSVQASNIGDWAALTDAQMNVVHTQTFYFDVTSNDAEPEGEATIQSPEQYLVKFNGQVAVAEGMYKNQTIDQLGENLNAAKVLTLQEYDSRDGWKDIDYNNSGNPIRIRKVSGTNEYIVELTTDWTVIYNTDSTGDNHYRNHRFRLYAAKDSLYNYDNGKKNSKDLEISLTDSTVTGCEKLLNEDNISPEIQNVQPSGKYYYAQLTEPVQVPMDPGSGREPTPSQKQGTSIQQPTARFINTTTKETIDGVVDNWLYEDDTWVRIEPEKVLSAGEWELTITALTDDTGNTISSRSYKFTVEGATSSSGLHVVWAAASNVDDYEVFRKGAYADDDPTPYPTGPARYIFVKFSEPMTNNALSTSALVNSNYTVSGVEVPRTGNVVGYIKNYSANNLNTFDSVTIDLGPNYQSFNLSEGRQVALTIASSITAASGNVLGDTGRITLPLNYGTNDGNITDITNRYSNKTNANDDVWGNDTTETAGFGLAKLQSALENESYRTVILPQNVNVPNKTTLKITRPVELDLNGKILELEAGSNMTITYSDTGIVKIGNSASTNGTIKCHDSSKDDKDGNDIYTNAVAIDTPNTDVLIGGVKRGKTDVKTEGKVVIHSLNIKDIKKNTLTNINGEIHTLVVTDAGGTGIINRDISTIKKLELNASADYALTNEGTMNQVIVTRANTVEVNATSNSSAIKSIESARSEAKLVINTTASKPASSLVKSSTGFGTVTDSNNNDLKGDSEVYSKALDTEVAKLASTNVSGGSIVITDAKGTANVTIGAGGNVQVDGQEVEYSISYKVALANDSDSTFLQISDDKKTVSVKPEPEWSGKKKFSVIVTATLTASSKTVEITKQKTIDLTFER